MLPFPSQNEYNGSPGLLNKVLRFLCSSVFHSCHVLRRFLEGTACLQRVCRWKARLEGEGETYVYPALGLSLSRSPISGGRLYQRRGAPESFVYLEVERLGGYTKARSEHSVTIRHPVKSIGATKRQRGRNLIRGITVGGGCGVTIHTDKGGHSTHSLLFLTVACEDSVCNAVMEWKKQLLVGRSVAYGLSHGPD